MGIMNGTTNFMLSKMEDEGADYSIVLAEAQRLGFAEADPTADVEGYDVQAKIALLTKLAFGVTVSVHTIPTKGISQITATDFAYAKSLQSTIKLLGTATQNTDGSLAVFVSPTLVPLSSPFSTAKGAGNMVNLLSVSPLFSFPLLYLNKISISNRWLCEVKIWDYLPLQDLVQVVFLPRIPC